VSERKKIDAVYVERKKITKCVNFLGTVLHLSNSKILGNSVKCYSDAGFE